MRTEKTYLDRDLVLGCFTDWVDRHGDVHTPDEMVEYERIAALPAAGVVEVIRCKDCAWCEEHYDTDGNVSYWICKNWYGGTDADGYKAKRRRNAAD